jgi:hypothetical protein
MTVIATVGDFVTDAGWIAEPNIAAQKEAALMKTFLRTCVCAYRTGLAR